MLICSYRRIYHSLCELVKQARTHRTSKLAELIALGKARTGDPSKVTKACCHITHVAISCVEMCSNRIEKN